VKIEHTPIPDVLVVELDRFGDARGFFMETWNAREFGALGIDATFVQDNHSRSQKHVLRGLHYQLCQAQGKLVRVASGEIWDVAVDLRRSSPSFGRWVGVKLEAAVPRAMWIPPGFAHGFLVLSESADVLYKTTDYYAPEHERALLWNDPAIGIAWPLAGATPVLSERDRRAAPLARAETYA
jgi:dTDP-4-dehydrorhamnose 3,5-epimerase